MRNSLSFKINILIIAVVTVVVSCLGGYDYYRDNKKRVETLDAELSRNIARLTTSLSNPLWTLDYEAIEAIVHAEMLNENIVAIELKRKQTFEPDIEIYYWKDFMEGEKAIREYWNTSLNNDRRY